MFVHKQALYTYVWQSCLMDEWRNANFSSNNVSIQPSIISCGKSLRFQQFYISWCFKVIASYVRGGSTGWARLRSPIDGCWLKNRDARPIKSRFYQSQNAQKLVFLSSKIENFYGEVPDPSTGVEGTPPHIPPSRRLDLRAYGARLEATSAFGARPRRLRRLGPRRLHSPPSHTFWICPWIM